MKPTVSGIQRVQREGVELVTARCQGEPREVADRLAEECGLSPGWTECSLERAESLAISILTTHLAYRVPRLTLEEAQSLWREEVPASPRACFTNVYHGEPGGSYSYQPITPATFSLGVVVVGDEQVFLVWGEDED